MEFGVAKIVADGSRRKGEFWTTAKIEKGKHDSMKFNLRVRKRQRCFNGIVGEWDETYSRVFASLHSMRKRFKIFCFAPLQRALVFCFPFGMLKNQERLLHFSCSEDSKSGFEAFHIHAEVVRYIVKRYIDEIRNFKFPLLRIINRWLNTSTTQQNDKIMIAKLF